MGINSKIGHKAVFLDRDGVVNKAIVIEGLPYPPKSIDELQILPGVRDGIAQLMQFNYKIFIVTNQPDVARGTALLDKVQEINYFLSKELFIEQVYCCFHDGIESCNCRKPKPGMILQAAEEWDLDLNNSFLIGDRWRDIEAAQNAGVTSILIDYNYNEKKVEPNHTCADFKSAVDFILNPKKQIYV
jgi:D-glycero-D-manno-heptose 1,7-bisphosphate phosphatase